MIGQTILEQFILDKVNEVFKSVGIDCYFKVKCESFETDDFGDGGWGEFVVNFKFGNCTKEHSMQLSINDDGDIGFADEGGDISTLTGSSLLFSLYSDFALVNLDDKYLN